MSVEDYYVSSHALEEDDEEYVSDGELQNLLIDYLKAVLKRLYFNENWFITNNMSIYEDYVKRSAPDVFVVKGVTLSLAELNELRSWKIGPHRPPPTVVFEVSSHSTADNDVNPKEKPLLYGQLGVKEYFAYDPQSPRAWRRGTPRLLGWRYDKNKASKEITPNEDGWLWSEELNSWLEASGSIFRLYDLQGNLRYTSEEAERIARFEAEEAVQVEHASRLLAEATALKAKDAQAQAELAKTAAELAKNNAQSALYQAQTQAKSERLAREAVEAQLQATEAKLEAERTARQAERLARLATETKLEAAELAAQEKELEILRLKDILRGVNIDFD